MSVCRSTTYLVIKLRHSHVLDLVAVSCPVGTTLVRLSVTLSLMLRVIKRYSIVLFCCCTVTGRPLQVAPRCLSTLGFVLQVMY